MKNQFKKDVKRAEDIIWTCGCVVMTISLCLLLNALFLV